MSSNIILVSHTCAWTIIALCLFMGAYIIQPII